MKNKIDTYDGQPTLEEWKAYRELQNEPFDFGDGLIYNDSIISDDAIYEMEIQNLEDKDNIKNRKYDYGVNIEENNYLKIKRRNRIRNNRRHKLHEFKFKATGYSSVDLCNFGIKILKYNGIFLPNYNKSFDYIDNMDLSLLRQMIIRVFKTNNIRYISLSSLNMWDLLDLALFCIRHKIKNKKYKKNTRNKCKKQLAKKIRHHKIEYKINDGCDYKRLTGYMSDELYFYHIDNKI